MNNLYSVSERDKTGIAEVTRGYIAEVTPALAGETRLILGR